MDLLDKLEIYIPVEAEVKSIPLWSLPKSVLRRMGLPVSGFKGCGKLADSPEGIWICPAVIRRKGQKLAPHAVNNMMENLSSLMGREFRANPGPVQMNFVSANHAVYKALKDTMPGKKGAAPHASPLPRGSAPQTYKDAVILYNGRIYLSIRNPNQSRSQPETSEQQLASQSSIPSTSAVSSKSLKKVMSFIDSFSLESRLSEQLREARRFPQASEPAEPQRKKSHVTLPQTSSKPLKDRLTKPETHSTTDQELLNDNRPKEKRITPKATHGENKKVTMHKGSDVSSTTAALHGPQSTGSVHRVDGRRHKEADGEPAAEEAAGAEAAWFQPLGAQEIKEEEANHDGGECGEPDDAVVLVEPSGNQSWTPQGAARGSTAIQEFDFRQLAGEEMIARKKAKLELLIMGDR